jgi:hypothetical protein
MCAKYIVDITATTSTNITPESHATNAVIIHVAITTTINNNNKNVGQIYNCHCDFNSMYKPTHELNN